MATGLEFIAAGINLFNITEARGEYSYSDMRAAKLPKLVRLVAKIDIPGIPLEEFILNNVQFDFRNPMESSADITMKFLQALMNMQQNKYLKYATDLAGI